MIGNRSNELHERRSSSRASTRIDISEQNRIADQKHHCSISSDSSAALLWPIPTAVLDSIFPGDDLAKVLTSLKLKNKYKHSREQCEYIKAERSYRTAQRHIFLLSSPDIRKAEQSIFASINKSITNGDSPSTQTQLSTLSISLDNTHRFLKGFLSRIVTRDAE
jgi:hypothetical protein